MRASATALVALLALSAPVGCSGDRADHGPVEPSEPSRSIRTLTPLPLPSPPPATGRLHAEMRQSSRDAAAGQMQVWIGNDTMRALRPTRITYRDPRYRTALSGVRLRRIPPRTEVGFPIRLPGRPACHQPRGRGTIEVSYRGATRTLRVADATDVAGRYARARCLKLRVDKVARLSWSEVVPFSGEVGDSATLTLLVEPSGRPGPTLSIDTISGTPVLAPARGDVWRPAATIRGLDRPARIDLPVKPNRCDAHAFAESGGATAFKIALRLGGRPGQITLRMSGAGAANAMRFAHDSCGELVAQ